MRIPILTRGRHGRRDHSISWETISTVKKFEGDWTSEDIDSGFADHALYDIVEKEGNLLVIGGVSALFQQLIGSGAITAFSNANAAIGVGDSSTAAADTQTALQAATNKLYKAMDSTYPQHTDSTGTAGSKTITWRSTFGTSDANYAWAEWGVFGAVTPGRMLLRKVEALGTKASGSTWQLQVANSLA